MTGPSSIYFERLGGSRARLIDVRALPEGVKAAIVSAALKIANQYESGEFACVEDGSVTDGTLAELASAVAGVYPQMSDVELVRAQT